MVAPSRLDILQVRRIRLIRTYTLLQSLTEEYSSWWSSGRNLLVTGRRSETGGSDIAYQRDTKFLTTFSLYHIPAKIAVASYPKSGARHLFARGRLQKSGKRGRMMRAWQENPRQMEDRKEA